MNPLALGSKEVHLAFTTWDMSYLDAKDIKYSWHHTTKSTPQISTRNPAKKGPTYLFSIYIALQEETIKYFYDS